MLADRAAAAGAGNGTGKVSLTKMYKEAAGHPPRIEQSGRVNAAAATREQRTSPPVAGGLCQRPVLLCVTALAALCIRLVYHAAQQTLDCIVFSTKSISLCWLCAICPLDMTIPWNTWAAMQAVCF